MRKLRQLLQRFIGSTPQGQAATIRERRSFSSRVDFPNPQIPAPNFGSRIDEFASRRAG
jgi:hypothetical protein